MAKRTWFSPGFRDAVMDATRKLESATNAEVMVAVRPTSGWYRHTDFAFGAGVAFVVLALFLYHPAAFEFTFLPIELALSFAVGVVLCASLPPLRRALTSKRLMIESAEMAARAAFVDLGVHRTRDRTGVLVFVAAFERRVVVVLDVGLTRAPPSPEWKAWCAKLSDSTRDGSDAFLGVLRDGSSLLAHMAPPRPDDTNELPDGLSEVKP